MGTIHGTVDSVQLVSGNPNGVGGYKVYLCECSFGAYTSSDSMDIPSVAATISAHVRDGKTRALVAGVIPVRAHAGQDTNGQAVYAGTMTISSDTLAGNLTDSAQTELTSVTACKGVGILVPVLET